MMIAQAKPSLLRRFAEYLARPLVLQRRLPAEFGRRVIYLSPHNRLRALSPRLEDFEPELMSAAKRFVKPSMCIWDIGANMGMFSLCAAHQAKHGMVLALEPDPFNLNLLHRSAAHASNRDLNLTILPLAISDQVGLLPLQIGMRNRATNSLQGAAHGSQMGGVRQIIQVMSVTLDWLAKRFPPPDLIKCDAEGAEIWILRGGAEIFSRHRPMLLIEVPQENAQVCSEILKAHNYALFAAHQPVEQHRELHAIGNAWEVFALPRERLAGFTEQSD